MLPPTPSATIAYKSPNACNLCHTDKDAAWADKYVREWRTRDYQAPVLKRAALIDAARKRDWKQLPEMLDYITEQGPRRGLCHLAHPAMVPSSGDPRVSSRSAQGHEGPLAARAWSGRRCPAACADQGSLQALVRRPAMTTGFVRVRALHRLAAYPEPSPE